MSDTPKEQPISPLDEPVIYLDDDAVATEVAATDSSTAVAVPVEPAPVSKTPNFNAQYRWSYQLTPTDVLRERLSLPTTSSVDGNAVLEKVPNLSLIDSAQGQEWAQTLREGAELTIFDDALMGAADRNAADYRQAIVHDKDPERPLAPSLPRFPVREGMKVSGERAVIRMKQMLGLGAIFSIPLWHSGHWFRVKAPSDAALLELYRAISAEKISLGRATAGLIYSNVTAYTARFLTDLVREHRYETTLNLPEGANILNYIRITDLHPLIWGLACSIYPNGFEYRRACISDPEKCQHVISERLDLTKLLWVDKSELTQRQVAQMAKRERGEVSLESIADYQREFLRGQEKVITIEANETSPKIQFTLRIPSIAEYVESSYRWVSRLEQTYGAALAQEPDRRDEYIVSHGKASIMRQHAHFVKSIEIVGGDIIDDLETIEMVLAELSSDDRITQQFTKKVTEYIDESTIAMVAIPTYTCPACGGEQKPHKENARHPRLIPLDAISAFFTLLVGRLQRINNR